MDGTRPQRREISGAGYTLSIRGRGVAACSTAYIRNLGGDILYGIIRNRRPAPLLWRAKIDGPVRARLGGPRGADSQKLDAEDAANKAADTVKKNRIKKLQWYTDTLNKRNYYTSATKLLIKDGKKALKKVEGYSEYDSMKTKFEEAVARAEALPVKAETPVVPTDGSDSSGNVDSGKYSEATATPEPTITPEPTAEPQ